MASTSSSFASLVRHTPRSATVRTVQRIRNFFQRQKHQHEKEQLEKEQAMHTLHHVKKRCKRVSGNPEASKFGYEQLQLQQKRQEKLRAEKNKQIMKELELTDRLYYETLEKKMNEKDEQLQTLRFKSIRSKAQFQVTDEQRKAKERIKFYKLKNQSFEQANDNPMVYHTPENFHQDLLENETEIVTLQRKNNTVPENSEAKKFAAREARLQMERSQRKQLELIKKSHKQLQLQMEKEAEKEMKMLAEKNRLLDRTHQKHTEAVKMTRLNEANLQAQQRIRRYKKMNAAQKTT